MATSLLRNGLRPELVRLRLKGTNKTDVIRELIDVLDEAHLLPNRAAAEQVVLAREATMSTGMEGGLAIPHGKSDTVDRLLVAVGLVPDGIDFGCVDGKPAQILFLTLSPTNRSGPHLRFMAEISQLLRNADIRRRILQAESPEDVIAILTQAES
jgi:mannitol/fructose-specific phosphotransferase system IIA component (Ntr-type)